MRKQAAQKKSVTQATGNIRIIAGKHRGRKLPVILADGLRPTTDRIKETVFNWLMPYVQDSRCLDCFSGAGSLGFEAFSRGAKAVTLIELNKLAAKQLSVNCLTLKADAIEVINADALNYLAVNKPTINEQFNLIFIDPPFRKNLCDLTIEKLQQGWIAPKAIIYIETEKEAQTLNIPNHWQLLKEKSAGQVSYRLYQA
ncbi:MAG: 16S rRNA (guanine(966)-N(2))-methyltransferase RsmD [Thalassotalea sp.]